MEGGRALKGQCVGRCKSSISMHRRESGTMIPMRLLAADNTTSKCVPYVGYQIRYGLNPNPNPIRSENMRYSGGTARLTEDIALEAWVGHVDGALEPHEIALPLGLHDDVLRRHIAVHEVETVHAGQPFNDGANHCGEGQDGVCAWRGGGGRAGVERWQRREDGRGGEMAAEEGKRAAHPCWRESPRRRRDREAVRAPVVGTGPCSGGLGPPRRWTR